MKIKDGKTEEFEKMKETNSHDAYSKATVGYAERWAEMMEAEISLDEEKFSGIKNAVVHHNLYFKKRALKLSFEASKEFGGVTGFMHGMAARILSEFWIHGEELRKWHNLDTQIGNEGEKANKSGGVLNPAVMVLGDKKEES